MIVYNISITLKRGELMLKTNFQKGLFTILVGLAIWFMPVPEGLKPQAMKVFAIFVATIVGFILHPLPIGAIALISVVIHA